MEKTLFCGLTICVNNDVVMVGGKTFEHKTILRELGGKWNPAMKKWIFKKTDDLSKLYLINKPSWFCGHKDARVVNLRTKSMWCLTCSDHGFIVNGTVYTGD